MAPRNVQELTLHFFDELDPLNEAVHISGACTI